MTTTASRGSGSGRPFLFAAGLVATVLAALALGRLAPPPSAAALSLHGPVVLLGWDGADPRVIEDLLGAGLMPNLRGLRQRGAYGRLRSHAPYLSPLLWTSVATGRRPPEHGVLDFVAGDPAGRVAPIGRGCRRVKALWELADERRLESLVVNWWASDPPDRVLGRVLSDREIRESRGAPEREAARRVIGRLIRGDGPADARMERLESFVAETLAMQRGLLDGLRAGKPQLVMAYSEIGRAHV